MQCVDLLHIYYSVITMIALANLTCVMSHYYHFFFMVRIFKMYSLKQLPSVEYSIINYNYYVKHEIHRTYLIDWKFILIDQHLNPFLPASDNHSSSLFLCFFKDFTYKWYHRLFVFLCLT